MGKLRLRKFNASFQNATNYMISLHFQHRLFQFQHCDFPERQSSAEGGCWRRVAWNSFLLFLNWCKLLDLSFLSFLIMGLITLSLQEGVETIQGAFASKVLGIATDT